MAGTTPTSNHRLWPDSGQILCHQYEISVTESQTFLFAKCIPTAMSEEKRLFLQPIKGLATKHIASKQALWGTLVAGGRKERLQLCLWNLNICIEKVNAKCWLAEMTCVYPWCVLSHVFQCLFTSALTSPLHWLAEIWQLSRWGNWRRNSNSRDVVASSPYFSRSTARVPQRACLLATKHTNKQFATLIALLIRLYLRPIYK